MARQATETATIVTFATENEVTVNGASAMSANGG